MSALSLLIVAAATIVLVALLNLRLARRWAPGTAPVRGPRPRHCPVCGSLLAGGETVRTAAYPGTEERLVHLYGCPRCSGPAASVVRRCPVCHGRLEGDDHLVGRLLPGQGRVKVWGCSRCGRSRPR